MIQHRDRPLAIHWFRRNLRVADNASLAAAAAGGRTVLGVFIIDDEQLRDEAMGAPRARYQGAALAELDQRLREHGSGLLIRRGDPAVVLAQLVDETGAVGITAVADVTPLNRKRERTVAAMLGSRGLRLELSDELYFTVPASTTQPDGRPYSVFSAYRRRFLGQLAEQGPGRPVSAPFAWLLPADQLPSGSRVPGAVDLGLAEGAEQLIAGGERAAQERLEGFIRASEGLAGYARLRDRPAHPTSRLSADLHFGTLSIRDVLRAALAFRAATEDPAVRRGADVWISELCWRDFYAAVMLHSPEVRTQEFRAEMRNLPWDDDPARFAAWCEGRTGYPIIDAAMRQLNSTGWMHNRCRMVVASFLTKDLHLDWRLGERYFLEHLVDADVANNNGGWQWAASTGTDPQPYFRIFNPVLQGERFDPEGAYVRRYVPELTPLPNNLIHRPGLLPATDRASLLSGEREYPAPIVDHAVERQVALAAYRGHSARPLPAPGR